MKAKIWSMLVVIIGLIGLSSDGFRDDSMAQAENGVRVSKPPFAVQFWDYLQKSYYRNWAPGPGATGDIYAGQSPHGAFLKMYLNRVAAGNPKSLPHESILVKENFGKDGKTLMAVTVMYRSKNFDPDHNDWYWIEYMPDGSVARTPPEKGSMPIAGKFKSCIECHAGAKGNDLTFVND
jgi:hypothetical protein